MGAKTTINHCLIIWCIIGFVTSLFCYIYIAQWISYNKDIKSGSNTHVCKVINYQITQSSGGSYQQGSVRVDDPHSCGVSVILDCPSNSHVKEKLKCGKLVCLDTAIETCTRQMPLYSNQTRHNFQRKLETYYTTEKYNSIGAKYSESPMPSVIALSVMTSLFAIGIIVPCIILNVKKN